MPEHTFPLGERVRLPGHFSEPVVLEAVRALGKGLNAACDCRVAAWRKWSCPARKPRLAAEAGVASTARAVDPPDLQLLIESARIRLAYAHDRQFAVSLSGIRTLRTRSRRSTRRCCPQPCLRFLLADDPGAGKTIMAGLLIKELKLREAIDRVLILCPAPLTIQWQDEMQRWFGETFDIIFAAVDQQQLVQPLAAMQPGHRFARLRQAGRCPRARLAAALGPGHHRRSPQVLGPHQERRRRPRTPGRCHQAIRTGREARRARPTTSCC